MKVVCVFILIVFVRANENEILQVPSPVMDFILGCERYLRGPKIPVARSTIDPETGIEEETVGLMDMKQLRSALEKSFDKESVVNHIITEIEQSITKQDQKIGRQSCTHVTVDVPEQKVKNLDGQLQAVIQQNNQQLLQQINTLFSFKLNSILEEIRSVLNESISSSTPSKTTSSVAQETTNQDSKVKDEVPAIRKDSDVETVQNEESSVPVEAVPDKVDNKRQSSFPVKRPLLPTRIRPNPNRRISSQNRISAAKRKEKLNEEQKVEAPAETPEASDANPQEKQTETEVAETEAEEKVEEEAKPEKTPRVVDRRKRLQDMRRRLLARRRGAQRRN